jgi:hypothetical protein
MISQARLDRETVGGLGRLVAPRSRHCAWLSETTPFERTLGVDQQLTPKAKGTAKKRTPVEKRS